MIFINNNNILSYIPLQVWIKNILNDFLNLQYLLMKLYLKSKRHILS